MVNTQYLVDGVDLDDEKWRWRLLRATLLPAVATRRVSHLEVPRRDGVYVRRGGWSTGSLKVSILVPDEGIHGATGSVELRLNQLQALLARASHIHKQSAGMPLLRVDVLGVEISTPAESEGRRGWTVEAVFELQPFWFQGDPVVSKAVSIPGNIVFPEWSGTTGDLQDAIVRVRGIGTQFSLVAPDGTGASFRYTLGGGSFVFIDVAAFRAWFGSSSQWTPNSTPVLVDYPPEGPLRLSPTSEGICLSVAGEGLDGAQLTLRASKWWL